MTWPERRVCDRHAAVGQKTGQAVASSVPALTTGTALMASYSFGKTARPCNMAHVMAHNA